MFDKPYEQRLTIWRDLRNNLETSSDTIQEAINFYNNAPDCLIAADPFTPSSWPTAWEIIEENNYCPFVKILAICYTLQLTDVLSQASYEIHITRDREKSATYYLLYVDDNVIGFDTETYVHRSKLPNTLRSELVHALPKQQ
jgi:hypothetical protein|tara:strand:+ start:1557 stop:1982 length:426 start_codon:yes stop_codon:yes gene_type:complete